MISKDPHVSGAIVFGRDKVKTGVLIDPSIEFKTENPEKLKTLIW